jgi:hypothetical protein
MKGSNTMTLIELMNENKMLIDELMQNFNAHKEERGEE